MKAIKQTATCMTWERKLGGDKSSQSRDIEAAKKLASEWRPA